MKLLQGRRGPRATFSGADRWLGRREASWLERLEPRLLLANPPPLAAWAFDENAGTAAVDATGNGRTGTISGATWTAAGRFGAALSFDGINDLVTVADHASLDLTTAMTLEAWVRPSASGDWRTAILKEANTGLSYALYTSDDAARPSAYANSGGPDRGAQGTAALAVNTWTHLTATYDGAALRLYVNGALAGSTPLTGTLAQSANPLRIGGNLVWGEYFAGLIDEVRIYNRALSVAEIAQDMSTPVGSVTPPTDSQPPAVSAVSPANGARNVAGTTNITVTFNETMSAASINASTFELRDPNGNLVPGVVSFDPATLTATLNPTPTLAVSADFYTVVVKGGASGVKDAAGNALAADFAWGFSTGTPTYQDSVALGGLVNPTVVRFAPDGRVFVAEKSGRIMLYDNLSDPTPSVFADLRTQVYNFWDRGLLGMALDPQFPARPYVYVLYTHDADLGGVAPKYGAPGVSSDPCPNPPGATGQGCLVTGRLTRLTAAGNVMTGPEHVLIHDWVQQFPSHSIGSIEFGPDGALYASGGDGASFNYADYGQTGNPFSDPANEGGAVRSLDLRTAGDPTTLDGTIIRIHPDTGAALPDNPLFASGDPNARRIIADGLRNPFRITVRPGTSEIWAGDVGWNTWEEINRVTAPQTFRSFGWPAYEGAARQGSYDNLNLPLIENYYNDASAHAVPFYAYNHSAQVVAGSGERTGGSAISGLAFYTGGSFPVAYRNALFFADYSRDTIYVMFAGPGGEPDPSNRAIVVVNSIENGTNPVNLIVGPDGDIYYPDFDRGTVRRIRFLSSNRPPVAAASASPTSGAAPLTVNFSAAGSSDPDGDPITYSWDLNADGVFGDSTSPTPSFTFTTPGTKNVQLRVTDSRVASSTTSLSINVSNTPPAPVIDTPLASLRWRVGDVINFSGRATDAEQGTLPAGALSWSLDLEHCFAPGNCHTHPLQSFSGVASGSFSAPDHEYPSFLVLKLTATDATGAAVTTSIELQPQTVNLTFNTSPPGLQLSAGSFTGLTPFTRTVIVGSNNSLSAPSPQTLGGTAYSFSAWSNGGAQNHNLIAGASPATYTATYAAAPVVPSLSINDVSTSEGNSGSKSLAFTVTLSSTSTQPVTVNFATAAGTASAGSDYATASGVLTIPAGSLTGTISVTLFGDTAVEPNETFVINLSAPTSATIADAQGQGTITNDDAVTGGLIAAYSFDAGSGGSLADASGNNHNGVITGAAWSPAGRFGSALSFDGVNDWVTVADTALLDLTNRMTLEAWVRPTSLNGWTTALMKERTGGLAYALYASDDAGRPPAGYITRGSDVSVPGTAALPLGVWTHLAMTYDGAALRLYVNGALAGTRSVTGNTATSASPLRIGGNAVWGEYFSGLIDEVRIYNRALSAAEIQADMATPVSGGALAAAAPATAVTPAPMNFNAAEPITSDLLTQDDDPLR